MPDHRCSLCFIELQKLNGNRSALIYLCPSSCFLDPSFPHFLSLFIAPNPKVARLIYFELSKMAPTSTRSSSISSSSTSSSKNSEGVKKKFGCSFPSCGKSFSRSEHLHRHALNHKDGNNTCLRCSAHFRRRDLLGKHISPQ